MAMIAARFAQRSLPIVLLSVLVACGSRARDTGIVALSVITRDFAFETSDSVPAGRVRMTMRNAGPSYHHVQVVRIERNLSWQEARDSLPEDGSLPSWMRAVGGAEGPDNYARIVTVDLDLRSGLHLLICRIYAPDRRAHSAHGMVRPLHVGAYADRAVLRLRDADVTVRLLDYAFVAPDTLPSGLRTLRIENRGRVDHHVALARLAPGKSIANALREQAPGEPPPYDVLGGTTALAPGEH
ncbi:MAG: hypothetical protein ACREOG_22410, partial [Gemmatimonadaceae bacterium]